MTTIILSDRAYIPIKNVDIDRVEKIFTKTVYDEEKCERCEYYAERHCEVCDTCPAYVGTFKLYNEKEFNDKRHVGIPIGSKNKIKKLIGTEKYKVKDLRTEPDFKNKIKFIGSEYDYQKVARREMLQAGYGILEAPPRSGKTVMGTAIVCKLGKKTLIMASQSDWLDNFYDTICGNEEKGVQAFTNASDIEKFEGKKIVGFAKTYEEFKKYDICLATYQTFISKKGQKLLKKIRKLFGVILVDEIHDAGAPWLSRVINQFKAKYRFGLTGTPDRKDKKMFIPLSIVGPVNHICEVETLTPTVQFIETGVSTPKDFRIIAYAYRFLAKNKQRNKLITKYVVNDLKEGHSIVIPVMTKKHMNELVDRINAAYGKKIAAAFHGQLPKVHRKKLLEDARSGKIKVVVGIRKIIQVGINVPKWSALYEVMPISNPPKFKQETSRILTPVEGKKKPIIRFFVDDFGLSRGCLRTCMYKGGMIAMKFKISPRDMEIARKYVKKGKITKSNFHSGGGIRSF